MTDQEFYEQVQKVVEMAKSELSVEFASILYQAGYEHGSGCQLKCDWHNMTCGECGYHLIQDNAEGCRKFNTPIKENNPACPDCVPREVPE